MMVVRRLLASGRKRSGRRGEEVEGEEEKGGKMVKNYRKGQKRKLEELRGEHKEIFRFHLRSKFSIGCK